MRKPLYQQLIESDKYKRHIYPPELTATENNKTHIFILNA